MIDMGISKVEYNGKTLMDISGDTVTEDTLGEGSTAHNSNGEPIVGKAVLGGDAVKSVNGYTGEVNLTASDVGALPDSIVLPTVPENVSAFNNDAGYISASDVDSIPVKGSSKPVSSGSVYDALFEIDAGMGTLVPPVTSVNGKTGDVVLSAEDIPHTHYWHEIELRPGTGSEELRASYSLDELIYIEKSSNCWYQSFDIAPDFVSGESVRVRIKLSGSDSFYERDCTVLSENGYYHGISFNNSAYSEKTIDDATYSHTAVPVNSDVPSFLLIFVPGSNCEVYADKDYTGAVIELAGTIVKLGNEALYVTDKVTKDSDVLITSGGVFNALSSAGGGGSSDVLMIPCYLDIVNMKIRAENNQLITTTQEIVEAFNSNKAIYLKVDVMQFVAEDDKPHMNFSYVIMPLTQCASTKSTDNYIMAFDGLLTVNGVPHIINCSLVSNSNAGDVTMFPLATLT